MTTIRGATHLIKYKKFQQSKTPKSRATGAYKKRNDELPEMGYESYYAYLKSEDWAALRSAILREFPGCATCDRPACQVHHYNYTPPVLLGLCNELLVPVCDACHHVIEFGRDGKKRDLPHAQQVLWAKVKPAHWQRLKDGLRKLWESRQNKRKTPELSPRQKRKKEKERRVKVAAEKWEARARELADPAPHSAAAKALLRPLPPPRCE